MKPFSYRLWATLIVSLALRWSFLFPSCWSVLVMKGGAGLWVICFSLMSEMMKSLFLSEAARPFASSSERRMTFEEPVYLPVSLSKSFPLATLCPSMLSIWEKKPSA